MDTVEVGMWEKNTGEFYQKWPFSLEKKTVQVDMLTLIWYVTFAHNTLSVFTS